LRYKEGTGAYEESLVQEIAQILNDQKSVPFFRIVVFKFSGHEDVIFKCLGLTKETAELSVVKKSRGHLYAFN